MDAQTILTTLALGNIARAMLSIFNNSSYMKNNFNKLKSVFLSLMLPFEILSKKSLCFSYMTALGSFGNFFYISAKISILQANQLQGYTFSEYNTYWRSPLHIIALPVNILQVVHVMQNCAHCSKCDVIGRTIPSLAQTIFP